MLFFLFAVLWSGISLSAQGLWTAIPTPASWAPDTSFGLRATKAGSRFASSFHGNPYATFGDSLFVGDPEGLTWKGIAYQKNHVRVRPLPLSVGQYNGNLAWGAKFSIDSGRTWSDSIASGRQPSALGVLNEPGWITGGMNDILFLSSDTAKTWKMVHDGKTFGYTLDLQVTWNDQVFASSESGPSLFSRDGGNTWTVLDSTLKTRIAMGRTSNIAVEYRAYTETVWLLAGKTSGYPNLVEIPMGISTDSLPAIQHWIFGVPEYGISAFAVGHVIQTGQTTLWLGTWGNGLYRSVDRGKTWVRDNQGLQDLHIEDIWVSNSGTTLVLTKEGLFRREGTGITSISNKANNPRPIRFLSASGKRLFQTAKGNSFGIDGRITKPTLASPHP